MPRVSTELEYIRLALSCPLLDYVYIGFGNASSLSQLRDAQQRMVGLSVTTIVCDFSQLGISNYLSVEFIRAASATRIPTGTLRQFSASSVEKNPTMVLFFSFFLERVRYFRSLTFVSRRRISEANIPRIPAVTVAIDGEDLNTSLSLGECDSACIQSATERSPRRAPSLGKIYVYVAFIPAQHAPRLTRIILILHRAVCFDLSLFGDYITSD